MDVKHAEEFFRLWVKPVVDGSAYLAKISEGIVKMGKPVKETDGTWTIPFYYRAQGWKDEQQVEP